MFERYTLYVLLLNCVIRSCVANRGSTAAKGGWVMCILFIVGAGIFGFIKDNQRRHHGAPPSPESDLEAPRVEEASTVNDT
mmetsp:Transcript_15150/g.20044  ORF Transcript_15150/g.20044 Transcript_15150/m.20044 type:complete len:81 (-) Transcript_15150:1914-2156(-)